MEEFLRAHGMAELCPEQELKLSARGQILLRGTEAVLILLHGETEHR